MLKELPVFPNHSFWTPHRLERFCGAATPIEYRSGAFILSPTDPQNAIFLIETGRATMYYYSDSGTVIAFAQSKPGDLLGTKGAFIKPERLFYAIADSNVRVWKMNHEAFLTLLREDFEFTRWQFSSVFQRLDRLERKTLNSLLLSAHQRLALTLLELCDQAKHTADSAVVISITQQELSNMLSVSRQTVAACLKRMQGRGILKTMRGKIELYDIAALRREVRHLTCTEN